MPKQFKTYTRFDGGLNTKTNARSIEDNELAQADNVTLDEFGVVQNCGGVATDSSNYATSAVTGLVAGYGLFQAKFDYNASSNTPTVATFVADTNASSDTKIDVLFAGGSWSTDVIDMGSSSGGQIIYHVADGGVRICDAKTANTGNAIKHYSNIERGGGWSGITPGGTAYPSAYQITDVKLSKPTAGIASLNIYFDGVNSSGNSYTLNSDTANIFQNAAIGSALDGTSFTDATCDTNHTAGSGSSFGGNPKIVQMDSTANIRVGMYVTGTGIAAYSYVTQIDSATLFRVNLDTTATNSNQTLTFDGGQYFAVNNDNDGVDAILERIDDDSIRTSDGGANWNDASHTWNMYPPSGQGWNLDINVSSSAGSWIAGTYEFASTFIYDNTQESLPYEMAGTVAISANDKLTCTVFATELAGADYNGNSRYPGRVTGGRIYCRISESDDEWVLLGDINISRGCRPSLSGSYVAWEAEYSSAPFVRSRFVSRSINADTYESLNGFSQDEKYISLGQDGENYQTSVVTNRRTFIANVKRYTQSNVLKIQSDTIMYSEVNRFDTFPSFNFIDIGINDGESFIKLESYADRLFAFKEKTLYVINIGSGSDTQWFLESEHKNMGVEFHAAVVKTDFGIAWVNKSGLFFYDGSQIRNLQTKIHDETWSSYIQSDSMIGYQPTHKHLLIMKSASDSGTDNGNCYIYNFVTNSFTFSNAMFVDANKSNMITDYNNKVIVKSSGGQMDAYDGDPDSHALFDIKLKDDDFGLPNIVKKIYGVTVEYASGADSSDGVKYFYTNDSGTKQGSANAGDLASTSGDLDINRITFGTPLLASSFQVQLDLNGSSLKKVNSVGVEYRPLYKRIT